MLTIIHGTDIVSSRKYFIDVKSQQSSAISLDGEKITLTEIVQEFEGGGLFEENRDFFLELLLSKRKKSAELTGILKSLQIYSENNNIYLWENKEITKGLLSTFKNSTVRIFKLPQNLFAFLDNLKPENGKNLIIYFHQTIENTDAEMVFFMLIRQLRVLLALSDKAHIEIEEIKRMAPWQKGKLENQARLFTTKDLISHYKKLYEIEKGLKTGSLSLTLPQAIDLFLLEI